MLIRDAVDYGADLLIHNTRRHSALSRMFLSNDDWQLVRCCPIPLLLVKENAWKEQPVLLAAVDPKHSRHKPAGLDHKILRVSEHIARNLDGKVMVMHSFNEIPLSGTYMKEAREEHKAAFDRLMADFDIPEDQCHLVEDAPEYGLQQLEADLHVDLIVMGAISRSLVSDVFIGNTTERVLDYLESDVLILKPDDFVSPLTL